MGNADKEQKSSPYILGPRRQRKMQHAALLMRLLYLLPFGFLDVQLMMAIADLSLSQDTTRHSTASRFNTHYQ